MKTIRHQLLVGLLYGMIACTLLAGSAVYMRVQQEANELFDFQLRQLVGSLPVRLTQQAESHERELMEIGDEGVVIQAWSIDGELLYVSQLGKLPGPLALPGPAPHDAEDGFATVTVQGVLWRLYRDVQHGRIVQAAQPVSVRGKLAAGLALRSMLPFLALIPTLALLIYIVVGRGLRPLSRLAQSVSRRSPEALQPVSTENLTPEIRPIVDALNSLLRQLDQALASQRAFVADAAHELRSPLTALKLQLQLAEKSQTDEQRLEAFAKLHDRLERSSHMVHQLLTLARHEPGREGRPFAPLDLHLLAQQCVADQYVLAESRGIDLGVEAGAGPLQVEGDMAGLRILLSNLIDNALRYTPEGGRVDVALRLEHGRPVLQVSDNGPGIPEAERERVLDRFYRREGSDMRGSGLGLSIVKNIAEEHGAEVRLTDHSPGRAGPGLTVSILFPTPEPAQPADAPSGRRLARLRKLKREADRAASV